MYLKNMVLEGFKSYGKRTEILNFDREFTAITGLNGTGKSNILDGICFVMGITNLGQVRAASLQDLVYKNGQAGITKATVTLVFDNSDEAHCPIGYEKCNEISVTRQVIVGGKNKYLINGKNVTNKKVIDLFCSVKLNVNNPNFLIMQGRITKVLNMKPIEILSMIEEAAGTSTYDVKRTETNKILEKKDHKLSEINSTLQEEIEPKLQRLRNDQANYLEYRKIVRDIENFTRVSVSYKYLQLCGSVEQIEKNLENMTKSIEDNRQRITDCEENTKIIDEECKELQNVIDSESGGSLQELERSLAEKIKIETVAISSKKALTNDLDAEKRNVTKLEKSIKDDTQLLENKQEAMNSFNDLFHNLKETNENDAKLYSDARKRLEVLNSGLTTNEAGESESLQQQLTSARTQLAESNTNIKRYDMESKHMNRLLKEKQSELKGNDSAYLSDKRKIEVTESEIKNLKRKLENITYEDGSFERLDSKKMDLIQELRQIKANLDRRNAHQFEFQYTDPQPNFDRSRVKGMICKLFDVVNQEHFMALSIVAGGSLFNVVTDTDITSKLILERGQLQRRTTIIPMNKIVSSAIHPSVEKQAQNLVGADNVSAAMSCIRYDKNYEKVLQYIFGQVLVCRNLEIAKKVAFHPSILKKCVTLEGDIVDPQGTLTGGSAPKGGAILLEISVVKNFEADLKAKEQVFRKLNSDIQQLETVSLSYNQLKEQIEQKQIDLNGIKARFAQTSFQQQQQEIDDLKEKLEKLRVDMETTREQITVLQERISDIEIKLKDQKGYHEREKNKATSEVKRLKLLSEKSKAEWVQKEEEYETLKLEIEEWKKSIERETKQLVESKKKIEIFESKVVGIVNESNESTTIVNELKAKIKEQKDQINKQNREIGKKHAERNKMQKEMNELSLTIKKTENQVHQLKNDNKEAFDRIKFYENKYTWIEEDKRFFGAKNTCYDYSKEDPKEVSKKLEKAERERSSMERIINVKAMTLLEREEKQYDEVIRKRSILDSDKCKIIHIIEELDKKRKTEMRNAWKAIDANFGKIFSSLLPGAESQLVPEPGKDFLFGLQIRVGFKGMWKESLTELSGGQRSLVALSLILAMLKYKPSPLYILDEVDAALDMNHTQNIGSMLTKHFNKSQFIIVSLKDGMFNNANTLFKTRFEDGVSVVSRTVNPRAVTNQQN